MHVEPGNAPLFRFAGHVFVFFPAQHVKLPARESVAANFCAHIDRAQDLPGVVELVDVPLIPLAQIIMFAIEAEVGAG